MKQAFLEVRRGVGDDVKEVDRGLVVPCLVPSWLASDIILQVMGNTWGTNRTVSSNLYFGRAMLQ
jgi:hypothetical protein